MKIGASLGISHSLFHFEFQCQKLTESSATSGLFMLNPMSSKCKHIPAWQLLTYSLVVRHFPLVPECHQNQEAKVLLMLPELKFVTHFACAKHQLNLKPRWGHLHLVVMEDSKSCRWRMSQHSRLLVERGRSWSEGAVLLRGC